MIQPVELHRREIGDGPPVLVLHGLLGQGRNWSTVARGIKGHRCLLVDLRNHGRSPHAGPMTYDAMAADLARLIESLGPAPVPIVGHSMGGKAAMTLALTRQDLVESLVVVDIAPISYGHGDTFKGYLDAMMALDLEAMTRRAEVDEALARQVEDRDVRAFLASNLESRDGRLSWSPALAILAGHLDPILGWPPAPPGAAYTGKTLFIRGERSAYVGSDAMAAIEPLFPAFTLETVADAGHWVHADAPAEVTAILNTFLM